MDEATLLARAEQQLTERGWTKHHYTASDGRVCSVGALLAVLIPEFSYETDPADISTHQSVLKQVDDACEHLNAVAAEQYPERCDDEDAGDAGVVWFNDHPDTTIEDVMRVFEKARVRAQEVVG
jgi:hypothetical protein